MGLFNNFPYTNMHELNIDYIIQKVNELYDRGTTLYAELEAWKTDTDAELTAWKTQTLSDLNDWKTALEGSLVSWKTATIADFNSQFATFESTLASYVTTFNGIKTDAEGYATAAAASATAAAGSATDAANAAQALNDLIPNQYKLSDARGWAVNLDDPFIGSCTAVSSGGNSALRIEYNASYKSYYWFQTTAQNCYFDADVPSYYSIAYGNPDPNATGWVEVIEGTRWEYALTSAGHRYRKSGQTNELPTVDSPLLIPAGSLVVITTRADDDRCPIYLDGYFLMSDRVILNDAQVDQVASDLTGRGIRVVVEPTRHIYVYTPTFVSGVFFKWDVYHKTNATNKVDGWIINDLQIVDSNDALVVPITSGGEWEQAIRLDGASDFIGIRNHKGEEYVAADLCFFANGKVIDASTSATYECSVFSMNEHSEMFDPDDYTAKVGDHYWRTTWTANNVFLSNRIVWSAAITTGSGAYMAMMPINRTADTIPITDRGFDGDTFVAYDISTAGFSNQMSQHLRRDMIAEYGRTSGVFAQLKITSELPDSAYSFIQNLSSPSYNKVYFSYCASGIEVTADTEWRMDAEYTITYR